VADVVDFFLGRRGDTAGDGRMSVKLRVMDVELEVLRNKTN
jgi:hypothetical protein